jgi:hypothetical protein
LSPYTIRGIVATLAAFFHWATAENYLTRNPMDPIKRPKMNWFRSCQWLVPITPIGNPNTDSLRVR